VFVVLYDIFGVTFNFFLRHESETNAAEAGNFVTDSRYLE